MNRLFREIQQLIASGELRPEDPLPPADELHRRFGASPEEVETAISELIYEGYLERERPAPTAEVCVPGYKLWGTLTGIHSVTREARKRGQAPGVEILTYARVPAWSPVMERLQLGAEDEIIVMDRLRKADGEPVAIETSYYPARYYPDMTKEMFESEGAEQSSFKVMEEKFGLKSARAVDQVGVTALEAREARLLELPAGTPVLLRFRVTFSDKDVPIKSSRAVWKFRAEYKMDLA